MWYCDTSALVKLLVRENESPALKKFLEGKEIVTSAITRVEMMRVVTLADPLLVPQTKNFLDYLEFIPVNQNVIRTAEDFDSSIRLRTLDALHFATILTVNDGIDGVITYDRKLAEAIDQIGQKVAAPTS
jgi:uncharacterized protein